MAGAKETPRQKLIALMYLVFITMLALNVSKEVLDGFGQMFKKIASANDRVDQSNDIYYNKIEVNAKEKEGKWIDNNRIAVEIKKEADEFYNKIQGIKDRITEKQRVDDPELVEYSRMDKGEELDLIFFDANGISEEGTKFLEMIRSYKAHVIQVFASKFPRYTELVEERFNTGDLEDMVETRDGTKQSWLQANYEGFPLSSSLAKLTMMQNDIRLTESDVLNALLGKELEIESKVNTSNYITLLKADKGAYYQGETFDGSVVLGRKGGAQNPNNVELTLDGRKLNEIRPIWSEIDYLPNAHGSAIFTRGETQSLTSVTLGTKLDEQMIDGAMHSGYNKFILHYNFPGFSTGEVRPNRGAGRREIGHGNLALRALKNMLPADEDNPYTIRIVSDILESNGSSSMATVCAGSLALMDAGIKLKKPVSGIAMGMISDSKTGKYAI